MFNRFIVNRLMIECGDGRRSKGWFGGFKLSDWVEGDFIYGEGYDL